jgi:hypothetical protein
MTVSRLQQHIEKILASGVLAALLFVGTAIYDMSGTLRVVLNRLDTLDAKFTVVDARFERYQTKEAARAAWEAQSLRDQMIHSRIDQVQNSVKAIDADENTR